MTTQGKAVALAFSFYRSALRWTVNFPFSLLDFDKAENGHFVCGGQAPTPRDPSGSPHARAPRLSTDIDCGVTYHMIIFQSMLRKPGLNNQERKWSPDPISRIKLGEIPWKSVLLLKVISKVPQVEYAQDPRAIHRSNICLGLLA